MTDSQLSAVYGIVLGASIATAATLITLYATGAFSGSDRKELEQPETGRGRPNTQCSIPGRDEWGSLKR